ncbi:hypothetical protein N7478_001556 [Penicillium angulare]|uniref:uncharacterized protein n=1 Tax=Penicillium angulare TaxID=116970 RepID=UPI0025400EF5|nr:uncharacterized protein N7478_001556 [Penicillium angulare]KAJ5288526.1 hypothetical protein N7478_001556 [Penicillium angulare]
MSTSSPSPDADVALYLHAELLPNIRQITLYISLQPNPALNAIHPKIHISNSCKSITVSLPEPFHYVTETIELPARVSDTTRLALSTNFARNTPPNLTGVSYEHSFRMQIDPTDPVLTPKDTIMDDYVPWTAADMSPLTRIRCRTCEAPFLSTPSARNDEHGEQDDSPGWEWKDLPSGNWAEMMDFWHCHKPDPQEDKPMSEVTAVRSSEDKTAQLKGYGATSRIEATPGIVFIDVATFLLAQSDCVGLQKTIEEGQEESELPRTLECANCKTITGLEDPSIGGWRCWKSNVSLNTNGSAAIQWQSHSDELIIAAQLLELIERESTRRFLVHNKRKNGLLLWVFNPDLRYSTSSKGRSINSQQAMKVFFQTTEDVDSILSRDTDLSSPLSMEELELPSIVLQTLTRALLKSHYMLPLSARSFNEWKIGLLNRYSRDDSSSV